MTLEAASSFAANGLDRFREGGVALQSAPLAAFFGGSRLCVSICGCIARSP